MIRHAALLLAALGAACQPPLDRMAYCGDGGGDRGDVFRVPDFPTQPTEGGGPGCVGTCPLGCNSSQDRCNRLKPSNFDASKLFDSATADLAPTGDLTLDGDTGEVKEGTTVIRAAGAQGTAVSGVFWDVVTQGSGAPEIAVFAVDTLDLPQGTTATVQGKRALALYVVQKATIAGTLLAAASKNGGGPGGFDGGLNNSLDGAACSGGEGKGGQQGPGGSDGDGGGGGGGFGGAGGAGADSDYPNPSPPSKGGAGGAVNGEASLVPLRGGCGGGAGGGPENGNGGYGGGGGGAIQIAVNGPLTVSGVISAPGAGGEGGHKGPAGGGGGAGGAILLEAIDLQVSGTLAANGGGGGSGSGGPGDDDVPEGQDGQPSDQPAAGGAVDPPYGGAGGQGGAGTTTDGTTPAVEANGGGGGGGVGRIRLNGNSVSSSGATVSPTASEGKPATW